MELSAENLVIEGTRNYSAALKKSEIRSAKKVDCFREHHWVKWGKFLLDIAALQLSLFLAVLLRHAFNAWWPIGISLDKYLDLSLGMLLIPLGYWLMRLYPGYGLNDVEKLRRRVRTTSVFFVIFTAMIFLIDKSGWGGSRGIFLMTFAFALVIPLQAQEIFRKILIRTNCWGTPVLVLGAGRTGAEVVTSLLRNANLGFKPVAILDDDASKWGTSVAGIPVLGGADYASKFTGRVNWALLAMPGAGRERLVELTKTLPFLHIIIVPDLKGLQSLWVDARDLVGMLGLEIQKKLLLRRNWLLKRFMDYCLVFPLFLASVPVLAFFALWIYLISPTNPFYFQVREGFRGKKFRVWKLRTMYPDADKLLKKHLDANPDASREWNSFFKLKNDPRIIKGVGAFLRKTSLDELPQLWNVLRGEMSLVGPRPFPHYHLEMFNADFRQMRRSVLPGMTGLWQVSARSDGDLTVQETLDTYYIRNWSIWMDLELLNRTVWVVLRGKGAY